MFIVIEGIDGAGCETQGKQLVNSLTREPVNKKAQLIKFPHYDTPVGQDDQRPPVSKSEDACQRTISPLYTPVYI